MGKGVLGTVVCHHIRHCDVSHYLALSRHIRQSLCYLLKRYLTILCTPFSLYAHCHHIRHSPCYHIRHSDAILRILLLCKALCHYIRHLLCHHIGYRCATILGTSLPPYWTLLCHNIRYKHCGPVLRSLPSTIPPLFKLCQTTINQHNLYSLTTSLTLCSSSTLHNSWHITNTNSRLLSLQVNFTVTLCPLDTTHRPKLSAIH